MQRIQVLQRGSGEYIHTDERVQLADEASGQTYEMLVRGTSEHPNQPGAVRIYIPDHAIERTFVINGYYVVELSPPLAGSAEATRRVERLRGAVTTSLS